MNEPTLREQVEYLINEQYIDTFDHKAVVDQVLDLITQQREEAVREFAYGLAKELTYALIDEYTVSETEADKYKDADEYDDMMLKLNDSPYDYQEVFQNVIDSKLTSSNKEEL